MKERKGSCQDYRELINLAVDDEIGARGRKALEEHLAECGGCARALDELSRTAEYIKGLPRKEVPGGFDSAVLASVAKARADAARLSSRRLYRAAAAAAALTALLATGSLAVIRDALLRFTLSLPGFLADGPELVVPSAKTVKTLSEVAGTLVSAWFSVAGYLSEQLLFHQTIILATTAALLGIYHITRVAARVRGAPASLI